MPQTTVKPNQTQNQAGNEKSAPTQPPVSNSKPAGATETNPGKQKKEIVKIKAPQNFIISPNLLIEEKKEILYYKIISETIARVCQIGLVMLLILGLMGGVILFRMGNQEKLYGSKLASADLTKLNDLKKIKKEVEDLNSSNVRIEQSLKKQYFFGELLSKLPEVTPQGVVLTNVVTPLDRPGWMKIVGIAKERDSFLEFKSGLEKTGLFEKIESPLSNYVDPESLGFELDAQVKSWSPKWGEDAKKQKSKSTEKEEE